MLLDELILIAVKGIGLGAVYALVALGLNVIYNATHILNFAQGSTFVLGALIGIYFSGTVGYGSAAWLMLMPVAGLVIAAVMAVQGWLTLWPLRQSTQQHSWLITTLSFSIVVSALMVLTQGPWSSQYTGSVPYVMIGFMRTPIPFLAMPAVAVAWWLILRLFSTHTLTGLALSALSQDLEAAAAAGLKIKRLQILSFAISGLIAGTAGYAAAPIISVGPDDGLRYVVAGFVAAVVGGLGSMFGAIVSGVVVGCVAMFAVYTLGGKYEGFVSLVILTFVLFLRPSGIFGTRATRRV